MEEVLTRSSLETETTTQASAHIGCIAAPATESRRVFLGEKTQPTAGSPRPPILVRAEQHAMYVAQQPTGSTTLGANKG